MDNCNSFSCDLLNWYLLPIYFWSLMRSVRNAKRGKLHFRCFFDELLNVADEIGWSKTSDKTFDIVDLSNCIFSNKKCYKHTFLFVIKAKTFIFSGKTLSIEGKLIFIYRLIDKGRKIIYLQTTFQLIDVNTSLINTKKNRFNVYRPISIFENN